MIISRGGSLILWDIDRPACESEWDEKMGRREKCRNKKLIMMNGIMLSLSDSQTILGIALLSAALAQNWNGSLGLYHLHLVYDMASFTAYVISYIILFIQKGVRKLTD